MVPNRKSMICILAAALMIMLAIPSFASSGAGDADQLSTETVLQQQETGETQETAGKEQQEGEPAPETGRDEQAEQSEQTEHSEQTEKPEQTENTEEPAGEAEKEESPQATGASAGPARAMLKASSGLPENNTKVSYTSAGSHPVKFTVKTGNYTFKGTCATLGVDNAKSGKATVKRLSSNSRIAKLVYYYGYKKGWWQGSNSTKKATAVMGFTDKNCTETAKQCIEALIQRDNMGWDDFWAARKVGKYRMYSTDTFMKEISALYKNTDVSKITIPDDVVFEMFHGVTSSSKQQDFYVWRYKEVPTTPNGFVAVEKVSGDVSITD